MGSLFLAFQTTGQDLFLAGLNNSHSGNLSVRQDARVLITRRGAMLGRLKEADLIETGLSENDANTEMASTELDVHRAIYQNSAAQAIVHAHPVHAIALSLTEDTITPVDAEGRFYFASIPILRPNNAIASPEVAAKLPPLLKEHKIVVIAGHGSFATGQNLEEAYHWTSALENACKIICLARSLR